MDLLKLARQTISDTHTRRIFRGDGDTDDIFNRIRFDLPEAIQQTRRFAAALFEVCGRDVETLLQTLYRFLVECVPFELDPNGYQYIKKPSALVHGKRRRADCKSYSLFIASVLSNLKIPYRFKFCSWDSDEVDVKHVFIEAFPHDDVRRRVLDVNLKEYNKEKKPNFNNRFIDMTAIYSVGSLPKTTKGYIKSSSIFDGRTTHEMSAAERDIRFLREAVRMEKARCTDDSQESEAHKDALDFINDILGEISSIEQTNDYEHARQRIAPIVYDYASGRYSLSGVKVSGVGALKVANYRKGEKLSINEHTRASNRAHLKAYRINALKNGTAKTFEDVKRINPGIGGFFGDVLDKLRKPVDWALDLKENVTDWFEDVRTATLQGVTPSKIRQMDNWARNTRREKLDPAERKRLEEIIESNKRVFPKICEEVKLAASSIGKAFLAATVAPAGLLSQSNRDKIEALWKGAYEDGIASLKKRLEIGLEPHAALACSLVCDLIPDSAEYFLYLFLMDRDEDLPEMVVNRRRDARRMRDKLMGPWQKLGLSKDVFEECLRDGINRKYGKTPERLIEEWRKQGKLDLKENKDAVGEAVVVIGLIIAIISLIWSIVQGIKHWDDDGYQYQSGTPNVTDWALSIASNSNGGTNGANGVTASAGGDYSKYLGYAEKASKLFNGIKSTYETFKADGNGTEAEMQKYLQMMNALSQSQQGINNVCSSIDMYKYQLGQLMSAIPYEDAELEAKRLEEIANLTKKIEDGKTELENYASIIETIESDQKSFLPWVIGGAAVLAGGYLLLKKKRR